MRNLLRWLLLFALVFGIALGDAVAQAPPPPGGRPPPAAVPATGKVTIEVMVVHATNDGTTVDAKIPAGILKHLKFLTYTGYSQLQTHSQSLGLKQQTTFSIVGGRKVMVQLLDQNDREAKIRVQMFNGAAKLLDTTVSIHRNRSFIVAGPKHQDGVLILPVTASY